MHVVSLWNSNGMQLHRSVTDFFFHSFSVSHSTDFVFVPFGSHSFERLSHIILLLLPIAFCSLTHHYARGWAQLTSECDGPKIADCIRGCNIASLNLFAGKTLSDSEKKNEIIVHQWFHRNGSVIGGRKWKPIQSGLNAYHVILSSDIVSYIIRTELNENVCVKAMILLSSASVSEQQKVWSYDGHRVRAYLCICIVINFTETSDLDGFIRINSVHLRPLHNTRPTRCGFFGGLKEVSAQPPRDPHKA